MLTPGVSAGRQAGSNGATLHLWHGARLPQESRPPRACAPPNLTCLSCPLCCFLPWPPLPPAEDHTSLQQLRTSRFACVPNGADIIIAS